MSKQTLGWHFLGESGKTRWNSVKVKAGQTLVHDGELVMCESGFHASKRLIDALEYAPGPILWRVKLHGTILVGDDKMVATRRTALWTIPQPNMDRIFRLWACWCIRNTKISGGRTVWDLLTDPRSRKAVEVAELFAVGKATKKELAAAWDAAWDAARDAARDAAWAAAKDAAWYAAWDAAGYAAWDAAGDAARDAARAAAWYAAWDAAKDAAWYAARDAARAAANKQFEKMVMDEAKALGLR